MAVRTWVEAGVERSMHFTDDGEGPPVLLLAGMASPLDVWEPVRAALLHRGARVVAVDVAGSGRSPIPATGLTARRVAADVIGLVDALAIPGVAVAGISMGGMVAQEVAALRPQAITRLALAFTAAAPDEFTRRLFAQWRRTAERGEIAAVMNDSLLRAFTFDFFLNRAAELADFEGGMDHDLPTVEAYTAQLDIVEGHDLAERAVRLRDVDTTVIVARDDTLIPPASTRALAAAIGAPVVEVPGGHGALWEHPDVVTDAFVSALLRNAS